MRKIIYKIILFTLVILISFYTTFKYNVYAIQTEVEKIEETNNLNEQENIEDEKVNIEKIEKDAIETSNNVEELDINSRIALIYDRASGEILYQKNGEKQTPMASTTKIMTAIVVLENVDLKETVTIDAKSAGIGGSRLGLKKNDKITVNDLLYGLLLRSGNDAAVALANYVGGSVEEFANMMNEKAKEIGLTNSHFIVPHGLDNEGHYTTAFELAKMADYALNIEKFREIVSTQTTTININGYTKAIYNTNQLVGSISGVYGVKTGFTNGAGRCLVTSCKRDDLDIITVIIGADTTKIRTSDTIKLIEYANKNFDMINIKEIVQEKFEQWLNINEGRIYVNKGMQNNVELYLEELEFENMAIQKNEKDNIELEVNSIFYLEAPVQVKQVIGNVKVSVDSKVIDVLDIYNTNEIQKKGIMDYIKQMLRIVCNAYSLL